MNKVAQWSALAVMILACSSTQAQDSGFDFGGRGVIGEGFSEIRDPRPQGSQVDINGGSRSYNPRPQGSQVDIYGGSRRYNPRLPQSDIRVRNAKENEVALYFTLNDKEYRLEAGQSIRMKDDRRWVIAFDRGSGASIARYKLRAGEYVFKPSKVGWELYRRHSAPRRPEPSD